MAGLSDLGAYAPAFMTVMSGMLSAGGQLMQASALGRSAQAKNTADNFQADQLDINANNAMGTGEAGAANTRLQTQYALSKDLAIAGASGAGAGDATVLNVMAGVQAMGGYQAAIKLYQGETSARADNLQAASLRWQGQEGIAESKDAMAGMDIGAVASLAKTGASLYDKYGKPGPSGTAFGT